MLLTLLLCALPQPMTVAPEASVLVAPQGNLEEDLKKFQKLIKGRGQEAEAIALVDGFVTKYKTNNERLIEIDEMLELKEGDARALKKEKKEVDKEQKKLSDTVASSFKRKQMTEPHMRLWKATVFALGQMGSHGANYLWKIFDDKRFTKDIEFRRLIVIQVGETRDFDQAEKLIDMLDYHQEAVIAAAGEAMAKFERAPGAVRREMVERTVKILEARHNAATDPQNTNAVRIYRTIREPLLRALSSLTGQSFRDPLDWTKWWNKNKKNKDVWADPA